jgi:hypothetical protein
MTMTQVDVNAIVAAVLAKSKGRKTNGRGRQKPTQAQSDAFRAANDAETIKLFTAAGYKLVEPRINVLTYNKWILQGRMVRKGEKSIRVGAFALFHRDQTDPLPVSSVAQTETVTRPVATGDTDGAPF